MTFMLCQLTCLVVVEALQSYQVNGTICEVCSLHMANQFYGGVYLTLESLF